MNLTSNLSRASLKRFIKSQVDLFEHFLDDFAGDEGDLRWYRTDHSVLRLEVEEQKEGLKLCSYVITIEIYISHVAK